MQICGCLRLAKVDTTSSNLTFSEVATRCHVVCHVRKGFPMLAACNYNPLNTKRREPGVEPSLRSLSDQTSRSHTFEDRRPQCFEYIRNHCGDCDSQNWSGISLLCGRRGTTVRASVAQNQGIITWDDFHIVYGLVAWTILTHTKWHTALIFLTKASTILCDLQCYCGQSLLWLPSRTSPQTSTSFAWMHVASAGSC